jgi:hypothetical protein
MAAWSLIEQLLFAILDLDHRMCNSATKKVRVALTRSSCVSDDCCGGLLGRNTSGGTHLFLRLVDFGHGGLVHRPRNSS